MPTIAGELKHHFRDSGWAVRVPRRCKELQHRMNRSRDLLIQRLRRMPGPADFAEHLGTGTDEVIQALRAENGYDTTPLTLAGGTAGPDRPPHGLGVSERGYELVELREVINHALTRVSRRERSAIVMRYFGEMTQAEIGAELGMSQVAVSRLLARTLRRLRRHVRDTR